jgi:hypothetical protein
VWASNCQVADFREIERALRDKEKLEEVYFEGNPVQKREPVLYRNKIRLALPQVSKIDACKFFPLCYPLLSSLRNVLTYGALLQLTSESTKISTYIANLNEKKKGRV